MTRLAPKRPASRQQVLDERQEAPIDTLPETVFLTRSSSSPVVDSKPPTAELTQMQLLQQERHATPGYWVPLSHSTPGCSIGPAIQHADPKAKGTRVPEAELWREDEEPGKDGDCH